MVCDSCGAEFKFARAELVDAGILCFCPKCGSNETRKGNIEPKLSISEADMDNMIVRFQVSVSRHDLEKARAMIGLADETPDLAVVMYASSIIMLISVLENDTRSFFYDRAKYMACIDEIDFRTTQAYHQSELSLRQRMRILPEVASNGKYTLNNNSVDVQVLNDMISKRNYLIHRKDYVLTSNVASIKDGFQKGTFWQVLENNIAVFGFDASRITLFSGLKSEALACYHAVKKYSEEIIFALDENKEISNIDSELLLKVEE
jgi:hypothetical protein